MGSPARIGLVIDALDEAYQTAVVHGAADAAREHAADLVVLAAGVLQPMLRRDSPDHSCRPRNVLFDLVGPDLVDGLVVVAGTLGNAVGAGGVALLAERWQPLPVVSLGVSIPGSARILVDNERGLARAVAHLVRQCGRRRIAFVRGPPTNREAERRFAGYRDGLVAHGLLLDDALVAGGSFERRAGAAAMAAVLDREGARPDAVLAASDTLALGCLDTLLDRGIDVPEAIAVVGFDDIAEARTAAIPLSTVRQPLREEGRRGVEAVLHWLEHGAPPPTTVLETELVVRRSSGGTRHAEPCAHDRVEDRSLPVALEADSEQIAEAIAAALPVPTGLRRARADQLLTAFTAELCGDAIGALSATLAVIVRPHRGEADGDAWQETMSILRREVLARQPSPALRASAEQLWHAARIQIAQSLEHARERAFVELERWAMSIGRSTAALVGDFDDTALASTIAEQFPRIGVSGCTLAEFTGADPHRARVVVAFDGTQASVGGPEEIGSVELLRAHARRHGPVRIVEPLCFGGESLGFAVFDYGPTQGAIYEALREQISAAVRGVRLVREVAAKERERTALMQHLEERAAQLERLHAALREGQRRLLVSETMSSLGQMTARARPLRQLLADVLTQLDELLGPLRAMVAMTPEDTPKYDPRDVILGPPGERTLVRVALRGSRQGMPHADAATVSALLSTAIRTGEMQRDTTELAVPLRAGGRLVGLLHLSRAGWSEHEIELVRTFAIQATVAIQNGQLYQMAALDPLTDVHARRFFDRWLPRQVHAAFVGRSALSLLMVDMDDLKRINDGGGHLAGDRALVDLGRVLRQATREPDVIARFGGDEFAVLLPDTDAGGATVVARRILQMCAAVEVRSFGPLRCSIGLTTLGRPDECNASTAMSGEVLEHVAEALVANGDAALYAAKRSGRAQLAEGAPTRWVAVRGGP